MKPVRQIITHTVQGSPQTCLIFVEDELGPGGAPHHYEIKRPNEIPITTIDFQKGGVREVGVVNGVTHEALLAIVIDRLENFQKGPFPSPYNQTALDHTIAALTALQDRTRERVAQGIEGLSVNPPAEGQPALPPPAEVAQPQPTPPAPESAPPPALPPATAAPQPTPMEKSRPPVVSLDLGV